VATGEVKIIECPRDAWQARAAHSGCEIKPNYLRALAGAGFRHITQSLSSLQRQCRKWPIRNAF